MAKRGVVANPDRDIVMKAIEKSGGIMTAIAKKLDMSWYTAKRIIDSDPEYTQAYNEENEMIIDMAEGALYKLVQMGDVGAVKFILGTKGRKRGYSDKTEIELTGKDGGAVQNEITVRFINKVEEVESN